MRLIDQLAALQRLDSSLDHDRRRYADLQAQLHEPEGLVQARSARDALAGKVEQWGKERRQRETAVADQTARIGALEQRLYGGQVTDAREQVALQKNIESLKRHLAALEEQTLEAILELEQAENELRVAEAALAEQQNDWQRNARQAQNEMQSLITHGRQIKTQRDTLAKDVDPAALRDYDALRQKKGGVAVAELQDTRCGACGALLPTALRQQVHGDNLVHCVLCGRILHA